MIVEFESLFRKRVKEIKSESLKLKVKKQIAKVVENPNIGKPLRYSRKRTREVYIPPFRLSYLYLENKGKVVFAYFLS